MLKITIGFRLCRKRLLKNVEVCKIIYTTSNDYIILLMEPRQLYKTMTFNKDFGFK